MTRRSKSEIVALLIEYIVYEGINIWQTCYDIKSKNFLSGFIEESDCILEFPTVCFITKEMFLVVWSVITRARILMTCHLFFFM
jgi:hypothetical protein